MKSNLFEQALEIDMPSISAKVAQLIENNEFYMDREGKLLKYMSLNYIIAR